MKGVARPSARRSRATAPLVKLEKFCDSYPHHLSGGMQQRVAIARALAYNPAVLLMDEPFAALDALTRDDMQRLLAEVWRETRKTVIYVTHNVAEAVYLADRVIVMTPHPGTVKAMIPITLPRPRDPLSVEFLDYQKELLRHLGHESADVVIVQPNFLAELASTSKVDAGDHPAFGRVGVGLAARADAPPRDIKTADAVKQLLLKADTIAFNNVASGNQFAKVLDRLGIAEEVKAKVTRTEPGKMYEPILNGSKDDIAAGTLTQIRADKRLKLIGPLPAELQTYLQYAAIPMTGAPNMKAAVEFVRFLFTPASVKAIRPTSGACRPTTCCAPAFWKSAGSSSRNSRALRQSHHAADGGAAGRSRHLCGALVHPRPRQGRPRRDRADRACRQDRACGGAQGFQPHQDRAAQGPEDRQPDRLVGRQHLRRPDRARAGLKKGDYQEVRMDVNNMITAMAAKTVDAMVNVEPYNAIAEADGLAVKIMNYRVDKMPVFMAATPDFVEKSPDAVVAYLKAWLEVARTSRTIPRRSRTRSTRSTPRRATQCRRTRSAKRWRPWMSPRSC
jgi:ABC-type proline/glycine betaine transport system ATPase subunit